MDIETRDEGHAAQRSYLDWLDGQTDDVDVDEDLARSAHVAGWTAGRDWARDQEMLASIREHGDRVRAEMDRR